VAVTRSNGKRQVPSGITRAPAPKLSRDLPRDIHGIDQARSRQSVADFVSDWARDLHVWLCSPNGIRTRVSTMRGWRTKPASETRGSPATARTTRSETRTCSAIVSRTQAAEQTPRGMRRRRTVARHRRPARRSPRNPPSAPRTMLGQKPRHRRRHGGRKRARRSRAGRVRSRSQAAAARRTSAIAAARTRRPRFRENIEAYLELAERLHVSVGQSRGRRARAPGGPGAASRRRRPAARRQRRQ
jgi:hypothetical protein